MPMYLDIDVSEKDPEDVVDAKTAKEWKVLHLMQPTKAKASAALAAHAQAKQAQQQQVELKHKKSIVGKVTGLMKKKSSTKFSAAQRQENVESDETEAETKTVPGGLIASTLSDEHTEAVNFLIRQGIADELLFVNSSPNPSNDAWQFEYFISSDKTESKDVPVMETARVNNPFFVEHLLIAFLNNNAADLKVPESKALKEKVLDLFTYLEKEKKVVLGPQIQAYRNKLGGKPVTFSATTTTTSTKTSTPSPNPPSSPKSYVEKQHEFPLGDDLKLKFKGETPWICIWDGDPNPNMFQALQITRQNGAEVTLRDLLAGTAKASDIDTIVYRTSFKDANDQEHLLTHTLRASVPRNSPYGPWFEGCTFADEEEQETSIFKYAPPAVAYDSLEDEEEVALPWQHYLMLPNNDALYEIVGRTGDNNIVYLESDVEHTHEVPLMSDADVVWFNSIPEYVAEPNPDNESNPFNDFGA